MAAFDLAAPPPWTQPLYWLQRVRQGGSFSGYSSADGSNWTQIGSAVTISMASNVFAGLAVTSNNNSTATTATFDNVLVTGGSPDFYLVPTPFARTVSTSANTSYYSVRIEPLNGFTSTTTSP